MNKRRIRRQIRAQAAKAVVDRMNKIMTGEPAKTFDNMPMVTPAKTTRKRTTKSKD